MKQRRLLLIFVAIILMGTVGSLWVWQAQRQHALNRQLIAALAHNDARQQLSLVKQGADPNTRFDPPPAPTLTLLLSQVLRHNSSPVNASPTALMLACGLYFDPKTRKEIGSFEQAENLPLLQAMLAHGANVRARTNYDVTALHYAVSRRRVHTAELLLQQGANVNAKDGGGETPLMYATATSMDVVRMLLSHGANVNAQDLSGNTALHTAILCSTPVAGGNAPHAAIFYIRSASVISELLAHGADPNLCNRQQESALMLAQRKQRTDLVPLLRKGVK